MYIFLQSACIKDFSIVAKTYIIYIYIPKVENATCSKLITTSGESNGNEAEERKDAVKEEHEREKEIEDDENRRDSYEEYVYIPSIFDNEM